MAGLTGLWWRFWRLAKPYWVSEERKRARWMLLWVILLLLAETQFNVLFNQQAGEITSALAAKDAPRFWRAIRWFLVVLVVAVPIFSFYYYQRDTLAIAWRTWLTKQVLGEYLKDRRYYELNAQTLIDNPDQRIAEDIATFTQKSLSFLFLTISAVLQLIAFSGVLWSISEELVIFLVVYATFGTLVTFRVFGKRLVFLNVLQLRKEADFRFGLVRVRENAEAVAFYRGEPREAATVWMRFSEVADNFRRMIRWTLNLSFFQFGYNLLTLALPSIIIAPRVLSGELEVGAVVRAAGAFTATLAALTVFVENFDALSRFTAGIERLERFLEYLRSPHVEFDAQRPTISIVGGTHVAFRGVTLHTPNYERTLVEGLSVDVEPGKGLVIVGVSGGGKSSLLRALGGLWRAGTGTIVRPDPGDMLFLPQHPYMLLGSLRSQLLYPKAQQSISDEALHEVLARVNLPNLAKHLGGLDTELDFGKVLSTGEQQRLSFARVLLGKPRYALLDEATSALDPDNEARLYRELRESGTTLISVSHRPATLRYHDMVLELLGQGRWRVHPATRYEFRSEFNVD